jgi:hypothetical protein
VTSLKESSYGEVGDNREKWGEFWESCPKGQVEKYVNVEACRGVDIPSVEGQNFSKKNLKFKSFKKFQNIFFIYKISKLRHHRTQF